MFLNVRYGKNHTPEFKLGDIRPGYVVKLRNGEYRLVVEAGCSPLGILLNTKTKEWSYKCAWNADLEYSLNDAKSIMYNAFFSLNHPDIGNECDTGSEYDIVEVWGYVSGADYSNAICASPEGRTLIWARPKVRKMTLEEISRELGCEVQVVDEK